MQYVEKPSAVGGGGNIFVDLPEQNRDDENLILYRGETAFVIMNAFPYTNGHLLVAPYRQIPDITGLNDQELLEIQKLLAKSVDWIRHCYNPDGFNIGVNMGRAGGAGIPMHIHWHIVPRWSGDTNFMTAVAETRVLPQSLQESYRRLKAAIETSAA
jgi:ATP adenylyltransferase